MKDIFNPVLNNKLEDDFVLFNISVDRFLEGKSKDYDLIPDDKLVEFYFNHKFKLVLEQIFDIFKAAMDDPMDHFKKVAVQTFTKFVRSHTTLQTPVTILNLIYRVTLAL